MLKHNPNQSPIATDRGRWQFGLRHLFGLTTLGAVAAALVAAFGPGTLMTSAGIVVAWLNWCGAFAGVQTGWRRSAVLWVAWSIFLVSLLLPALNIFGPVPGWGAAWIVILAPWQIISNSERLTPEVLIYLLMDVANLLVITMPLLIWRLQRGGGQWLSTTLSLAMVSAWVVAWEGEMLIGYYVWCASFLLALAALPMRGLIFGAMSALTVLLILIAAWDLIMRANVEGPVPI